MFSGWRYLDLSALHQLNCVISGCEGKQLTQYISYRSQSKNLLTPIVITECQRAYKKMTLHERALVPSLNCPRQSLPDESASLKG